jgi:hypothetical protein
MAKKKAAKKTAKKKAAKKTAKKKSPDLPPSNEPKRGARILALGVTEGVESHATREEVCRGADHRQAA